MSTRPELVITLIKQEKEDEENQDANEEGNFLDIFNQSQGGRANIKFEVVESPFVGITGIEEQLDLINRPKLNGLDANGGNLKKPEHAKKDKVWNIEINTDGDNTSKMKNIFNGEEVTITRIPMTTRKKQQKPTNLIPLTHLKKETEIDIDEEIFDKEKEKLSQLQNDTTEEEIVVDDGIFDRKKNQTSQLQKNSIKSDATQDNSLCQNHLERRYNTRGKHSVLTAKNASAICTNKCCGGCKGFTKVVKVLNENETPDNASPFQYPCTLCRKAFTKKGYLTRHILSSHPKVKAYECNLCTDRFRFKKTLILHNSVHSSEKPFKCDLCGKLLHSRKGLGEHIILHDSLRPFKCDKCNKSYELQTALQRHQMNHPKEPPKVSGGYKKKKKIKSKKHLKKKQPDNNYYSCDICHKSFTTLQSWRVHKVVHTGERAYVCDICNKSFKYSSSLNSHKLLHTGIKPYVCKVCDRAFSRARNLKTHSALVHRVKQEVHTCTACYSIFGSAEELLAHQKTHPKKPFSCKFCDKKYTCLPFLKIHHERVHPDIELNTENCEIKADVIKREKINSTKKGQLADLDIEIFSYPDDITHVCEYCEETFNSEETLNEHIKTHSGDRPFVCTICNKSFPTRKKFKVHKPIHYVKRFECDDCGRKFRFLRSLRLHKFVHSGQKPFACDVCSKSYNQKSALIVHKRIHTGERPYACKLCPRTFHSRANYYSHEISHTTEKPHECDMCGKKFKLATILAAHKTLHEKKPYICEVCGKIYKNHSSLNSHKVIHTELRVFKCNDCNKSFFEQATLTRHQENRCGKLDEGDNGLYVCSICWEGFEGAHHLTFHHNFVHAAAAAAAPAPVPIVSGPAIIQYKIVDAILIQNDETDYDTIALIN